MAYNVSNAFREQCYKGSSLYKCRLIMGGNIIPTSQLASITISSPIIDSSSQTFYIGTFISQKLTIQFKNLNGIEITSGTNVELYISQCVNDEWVEVPIGKYSIDGSPENYYKSSQIECLDYAIKFATNLDYSPAFVDNKITIDNLLQWICNHYGVTLGDYPNTNGNVEIGTYDSTVSGKRWISYIAEIKGCNAKMDRLGRLTLVPLKSPPVVTINALKSKSWELGEKYEVKKVIFFDAIRNYTYGDDTGNILCLRQDNPFIINTNIVQNVYNAVKDFACWSLKCENYGDISLDSWDRIAYALGNSTYYTLNNNTITYAMTIMSKVETKIPTKQQEVTTNVVEGNNEQRIRRLKTEINNIDNTITLQAQQIKTNTTNIATNTSNISTANTNINNLQTQVNGISADFDDFYDNEYVQSISNLQDQIDGAVQFWNGSEIPTLNNYPANLWTTEEEKRNHEADIYSVIQGDKQGKSYRFAKVGNVWQWVELTDNELSAVQQLAQNALNKANTNGQDINNINDELSNPTNTLTGQYFDIDNALDSPLIDFSLYGETQQNNAILPSTYQQVEYIESSGTQYINTNYKHKSTTKVELKAKVYSPSGISNYASIFGSRKDTYRQNAMGFFYRFSGNNKGVYFRTGQETQGDAFDLDTLFDLTVSNTTATWTNTNGTRTITTTGTVDNGINAMFIFNINRSSVEDGIRVDISPAYMKLYSFKIYEGTTPIRNFIPCYRISDNVIGLYDLVNNVFYTNAGTGKFTKGNNVTLPTPDYPQEIHNVSGDNTIKIQNRNLFKVHSGTTVTSANVQFTRNNDETITINGTSNTTGFVEMLYDFKNGTTQQSTPTLILNSSNTYKVSLNKLSGTTTSEDIRFVTQYDSAGSHLITYIGTSETISNSNGLYRAYLRIPNGATFNNLVVGVQIEKGTTSTDYVPHQEQSQLISLGDIELLKIGNYKDYIHRQDNRWYLHEETGKVVLNGSESGWVYEYNEGYIRCYKNIVNGNTISSRTTFISNRFRFASSGLDVGTGFIFASKIYLFVPRNLTSLADFKVWLSNNNVTLCYPLAEPTDTEITGTLLEQLNRLMTLPLYKNMTHITIEPNDLTPIMNIEYVRDTAINSQFVRQPQLNNYYTRTETTAQINISNSSIKSDVAEIQTTLANNGSTISSLSRKVQTLQSSTSLQINAINKTLEDGVEKLTNSLVTIDINGINTSKDNETFNTQITNKTFEVKDGDNRMGFMGFDTDKQKMLVEFPEMQTQKLTNAYHTTEKITEDGLKWSADFYVGDDN